MSAIEANEPGGDGVDEPVAVVVSRPVVIVNGSRLIRQTWLASALLDEVRAGELDEHSRRRLMSAWAGLVYEVGCALAPEVVEEFKRLLPRKDEWPLTDDELRVRFAQVVGWLNGVLKGEQFSELGALIAGTEGLAELLESRAAAQAAEPPPKPVPSGYL